MLVKYVMFLFLQIIDNLCSGLSEDGSHFEISEPDRTESKKLWRSRETRVLHSIVNVAFQQKVSHKMNLCF